MLPRTLYLESYDRFDEILEYQLPEGNFAVALPMLRTHTFGAFTREGEHVSGVFASPSGPVFFLDARHAVLQFGCSSATIEADRDGSMRQFTLRHDEGARKGKIEFSLRYRERVGIGTNPYDTEPEDVDLFAMLATGLRSEQFFKNYTKDWV